MKRIQLGLMLALVAGQAAAQRSYTGTQVTTRMPFGMSTDREVTDTLVPPSFLAGSSLYLYEDSAGGYLFGTNSYNDFAKVQVFQTTGPVNVEGLLLLVGAVEGTSTGHVLANVYALDGPGINGAAQEVNTAPGTVLGSVAIPFSDISTTAITSVMFDSPIYAASSFAAGIDVSELYDDSAWIGLYSSAPDTVGTTEDGTWEMWDDGTWVSIAAAWGAQWDIGVLAVVDAGSVGINDTERVNGMRMSILGGNPAAANVQLAYDLEHDANSRVVVIDTKGARQFEANLGRMSRGEHRMDLNVADWANGTYFVTVFANGYPLTKKLVVQH